MPQREITPELNWKWIGSLIVLFITVATLTYGALSMANPPDAYQPPPWPQVVRTVDGTLTTPMPEDLDRPTG